jgi:N12 class adenine-specific DNA methylase
MEQKRLGLTKAMMVVPGHCLAQASRELLQLYPTARILVAGETKFRQGQAPAVSCHCDRAMGLRPHHP